MVQLGAIACSGGIKQCQRIIKQCSDWMDENGFKSVKELQGEALKLFNMDQSFAKERQKKLDEVKQYVEELHRENPKVADIMSNLIYEIELDENKYKGQSILNIVENMKHDCIDKVITDFCITWYASKDDVMYAATHYRNGVIPNESAIKATIDYTSYKEAQEKALPKFKYYAQMITELRKTLDDEIKPLISQ